MICEDHVELIGKYAKKVKNKNKNQAGRHKERRERANADGIAEVAKLNETTKEE